MRASIIATQSYLPAWMQEHRGLRWSDMPGSDKDTKKLNFFLFRRGEYDPDLDAVTEEDSGLSGEELKTAKRDARGNVLIKTRRVSFGSVTHLTPRGAMAMAAKIERRAKDLATREARQHAILDRYAEAKQAKGFVSALVKQDVTAHSALARAMGLGRGSKRPLRSGTLDRVERAFEALKQEGWNFL